MTLFFWIGSHIFKVCGFEIWMEHLHCISSLASGESAFKFNVSSRVSTNPISDARNFSSSPTRGVSPYHPEKYILKGAVNRNLLYQRKILSPGQFSGANCSKSVTCVTQRAVSFRAYRCTEHVSAALALPRHVVSILVRSYMG